MTQWTQPAAAGAHPPAPAILIVDDNRVTAMALSKLLESSNFHTCIALRGSEALQHAQSEKFAAALVDVHLPDMNGLALSQKLREALGPNLPIIVLSGDTSMEVINALSRVGATYFFSKPINTADLLGKLKECVGREPEKPKA